ncbi:MAG TPA: ferrous iron transport protein B [Ignavibacteriaceae bacterium]|nr:ferrous iron transport protein B [Ignavibacteriaceae bacterium]
MNIQTEVNIPHISLVGPPNSGKTTLFNYLSGKNYKTVNYPGATVEYSICKLQDKFGYNANVIDTPGLISLLPGSPDEEISINSLYSHPRFGTPDLIIVTVDTSQLSRHLLIVKQLLSCHFNIIVALTMLDILKRKNYDIDSEKLSSLLNCPVIKVDPRTGSGVIELIEKVETLVNNKVPLNKERTSRLDERDSFNDLLATYREIEAIENEVLIKISPINLTKANKRLKILINPEAKIECKEIDRTTLKIDKVLLHKVWGIFFFFIIMAVTFTSIFWLAEPLMNMVDSLFGFLSAAAFNFLGNNWFGDFIAKGIISGTGSVLVFVPQILILFLILGLLEDSGYLARGAMLIDKPLSRIGLNGKSFVPMLSGFACAIPAMMATRTIPNKRERFLTIFILPLMSCSARIPVYALLIAFLFPADKSWMGGIMLACIYIFSIVSSVAVAGIINKFKNTLIKTEDNSSFILELPAYRKPKLKVVVTNTYHNGKHYVKKAGPIILGFSIILWFLTYFPNTSPKIDTGNLTKLQLVESQNAARLSSSYAAEMGKLIQPAMKPLGMDWRVGVSLIAAFTAREVFVSSLALIFKVTDDINKDFQNSMITAMRKAEIDGTGQKLFTTSTIIGLVVFFVFALQCLSTVAVSRKETGGWRIPLLQLLIFTSTAYLLTFITVNGLRALGFS